MRYGYVKDPNDKHKIIVDPEAAEVVKLIFELTEQGKRKTEVANYLNAHGIDTPSAYKKRKGSKNFFHAVEVKSLWSTSSIRDILNDEVYLGKLIWNKTKKRVGSNNTSTYVPKDEWIVIENCHEPIITQKLFDMAHANSKKYIRPKRGKRNYNPFYYCGVCGRALAPSKRVKGDILLCSSSRIEKNSPCKSNRVEIAKVEDAIMKIVNMYATAYLDEKGIKKAGKSKEVSPEEKIATLEKKVKSLSSKKMMLYSDYKDDKLTREEYVKPSYKEFRDVLDEINTDIQLGTTGNGLISVKVAAHLLDWGVETSMTTDEVKKETVSWLSDKGNSEQVEFSNKLASVYDAYQKLLGSDAKELLEQAGCDDAAYSWSDAPVETIEAIVEVVQLPEEQTMDDSNSSTEKFENKDNWPDVEELVNRRGDETTVYLLADGRYMDRINAVYIYDGKDTWTDEAGVEWNKAVK